MSEDYPILEGDRVAHIRELALTGVVISIDRNLPHPTTCNVKWDDGCIDTQWTNKIVKID